jgi:putative hydrolase of HD superfamily
MNDAIQVLNILSFTQKLKSQERTIKISEKRFESVADHSWHLSMMLLVVSPYINAEIDLFKALKMALIHDLVEAEIGDTPYGYSAKDKKVKAKKKLAEEKEAKKIEKMIGGKFGNEFFQLWLEYEEQKTDEAKVIKALDSLEANYQSILFDVSYWDDYFYKIALNKAEKYCKEEKILENLNDEITNRMEREFIKAGLDIEKIRNS